MNGSRTGSINTGVAILVALLAATLVVTGACAKKEAPPERKASVAEHKGGTEQKGEHREDTVELDPEAVKTAGIEVREVMPIAASELIGATAVLEVNGDRMSRVGSRVTGRCVKVNASLGDRIKANQVLAQIDSVEMGQTWSDYMKAKAHMELATRAVKREETLFQKKVSPEKDLLKARQELGQAEADMLLAQEKFRILGVEVRQLDTNTNGTSHNRPLIPVASPLPGVVIEKSVTQGEAVGADKTLFTVADLSTLWLMIDIYERDIGRVKTGMQIKLSSVSYPGKEFRGRISYIGDVMDEKSRTVKARVTIDNRHGLLKPGMFASASINSVKEGTAGTVIAVPEEAVFLDGSQRYVFILQGEGRFAVREVLAGPASGVRIEIREGLKQGDQVVVKGVFVLKSELKKKTLGDEH
jgi:cobalt-zinc-cadmium efflux system membrane fusion protein